MTESDNRGDRPCHIPAVLCEFRLFLRGTKYFTRHLHVFVGRSWIRGIMAGQAEIRDAWTEIAAGYDEHVTPSNMAIAEKALQRVELRPDV